PPGTEGQMTPKPDHGEQSYRGKGLLEGKVALLTGADSGIGKAVAIAFAREGADLLLSYLDEHEDAKDTQHWVEQAGRRAVLAPGDVKDPAHCRTLVDQAVHELGRLDILVNNAAYQMEHESVEEVSDEEWDHTLATNLSAFFHLTKAALPHLQPGSSIVATSSVNSDTPSPSLFPYDVTKAGLANMCAALAQLLGPKGIRVNSVAPGPIWTPLIPSTMPSEHVEKFGQSTPLGRAGLRAARLRRGQLHLRRPRRGHGRTPHPLTAVPARGW
ncbi:MAG TPA: SDR family oxidoreductase, partial [Segeticoccus sp.]|uniref:SDR family oxidoreductase n=1 Tax=Segeticoccus sp. TaxID=2706531 RepID=UPI002D8076E3